MSRILAAAAVIAVLTAVVNWEVALYATAEPDPLPTRQSAADVPPGAVGSASQPPAATWVATALERPLFRENRRPAEAAGGTAGVDKAARLTGVITGPFGNRSIFMVSGESKPVVVREGERVGDFVVRSIGPSQTIVETANGLRTLRPSFVGDDVAARQ